MKPKTEQCPTKTKPKILFQLSIHIYLSNFECGTCLDDITKSMFSTCFKIGSRGRISHVSVIWRLKYLLF